MPHLFVQIVLTEAVHQLMLHHLGGEVLGGQGLFAQCCPRLNFPGN